MKRQNYRYVIFVHPSALVMDEMRIGESVQIMAGAIVQTGCVIGDNVIINASAMLDQD